MRDDKLAAILSGLSPPGMSPASRPPPTPGTGAKMRTETGRALEQAMSRGSENALSHYGLKSAGLPVTAAPAASMTRSTRLPIGRALGYGALAAGGLTALGLHHQNQEDRAAQSLVYAPLGGLS